MSFGSVSKYVFVYSPTPLHACVPIRVRLFAIPRIVACQAPLSMEFSRQEYWSRFPFPSPGDLPNPVIESEALVSPALAGRGWGCLFFFSPAEPLGKPNLCKSLYLDVMCVPCAFCICVCSGEPLSM